MLEVLTDNVLTACASASMTARARLVGVVARAAAVSDTALDSSSSALVSSSSLAPAGLGSSSGDGQSGVSSSGRSSTGGAASAVCPLSPGFKQLCVQKLFQMCGRGCEGQGSNKCHLEVAQLTISPLMERYRLRDLSFCGMCFALRVCMDMATYVYSRRWC